MGEGGEAAPLGDVTNDVNRGAKERKPRTPRPVKQRGPPEDGIPSSTKVMVANLPYDLSEEKVILEGSTTRLPQLTPSLA